MRFLRWAEILMHQEGVEVQICFGAVSFLLALSLCPFLCGGNSAASGNPPTHP